MKTKKAFQGKRAFAILFTIVLVVVISYFSYSIVQSNTFSSNLNKLKYLHLQANIHLDFLKEYIKNHTETQIANFTLGDTRFGHSIVPKDENGTMRYYITLQTVDDTPVRVSAVVEK